jgi:membrane-associated protein
VFAVELHAAAQVLAINPLNASDLISTFGVIGVLAILFAETGLLIGFFFPGDSLLFLGGIAASTLAAEIFPGVQLNLWVLLIGAPICAIAGAQVGHYLGTRLGRRMLHKPNSRIFKPEYVERAEHYFNKFGPAKAVILARFIPIVRTFLNPVAGVLEMPARQFFVYNVIGGLLWTDGVLLLGYLFAGQITKIIPADKLDNYLAPLVIVIVAISAIPIYIEVYRNWRERKRARASASQSTSQSTPPSGPQSGPQSGSQSAPQSAPQSQQALARPESSRTETEPGRHRA